jgi:hypothetical protein
MTPETSMTPRTFASMPDTLEPVVASAANPSYYDAVMDVGAAPIHVPAKRLQATLASEVFPLAQSAMYESLTPWAEVVGFLDGNADVSVSFEANAGRNMSLFAANETVAMAVELDGRWNEWTVTVAATDRETSRKWLDAMAALLPAPPPPPPPPERPWNVIPVRFWMQGPNGTASSRWRDITVTHWSDIAPNYPSAARASLTSLVSMDAVTGGKLILLHGPPGTGKTRALLSLMSEWRTWCASSVVTDTDRFFGDPTYLNSLIFNAEGAQDWMALILEDADEYIATSARENKGQSIARLLNVADGIVGQGLNLLFVMTTNVDVQELNPAIVRPGRCLANINVGPFTHAEANAWVAERGGPASTFGADDPSPTLAAMYAALTPDT